LREAIEELGGNRKSVRSIDTNAVLAAVVEQDVCARVSPLGAMEAAVDVSDDLRRTDRRPVVAHDVPLDELEAELGGDVEDGWTPRSVGRAEVADWSAERVFESLIAGAEFFADDARGLEAEPGMRVGVVADEVAGGMNSADDVRALTDEAADHEESSAGFVAGENVEQPVGVGVVGAVVVGEGDFFGIATRDEGATEELGPRAEGCVGERAGCGCGDGCSAKNLGDARVEHDYFLSSARTSSAWPSGLTLLNSWMSFWSGPMT
jgi:hypothetical protein